MHFSLSLLSDNLNVNEGISKKSRLYGRPATDEGHARDL